MPDGKHIIDAPAATDVVGMIENSFPRAFIQADIDARVCELVLEPLRGLNAIVGKDVQVCRP